jgi:hypothetical protein
MGTGAANLGRLVGAFHFDILKGSVQAQRHKEAIEPLTKLPMTLSGEP